MSLVSNFIGEIASSQFGVSKVTPNIDLNDTTFAELLQKQISNQIKTQETPFMPQLGTPAGFQIDNFDNQLEQIDTQISTNAIEERTTSETVTFFSSLLDNKENPESEIFDFAKKQAANIYNKYSRSVITDVSEFVEDIKNMI